MIEQRNLSELKNWDKNPRGIKVNDFKRLKAQIKELGLYKPFLITTDGTVLGGNMRLRACRELGIQEVDVSVVAAETDELKLKYALSDNDRAGYYEEQQLAELVLSIPEIKLDDYKIDLGQLTSIDDLLSQFAPDVVEDEVPEDVDTVAKLGDVWQLGRHRLVCGDSTKIEDVEKLMDGKKADMVFTDPPYGIDYVDVKKKHKKIANDDGVSISFLCSLLPKECPSYVCCNWRCVPEFMDALPDAKALIVWDKGHGAQNLDKFYKEHEFILYYGPYGGEKTVDGDVWRINREVRKDHPTAKPIELVARALSYSSDIDDIVLDLFGGSGSTLIACEQTNRTCYMMELDEHYCDVIIARWEKFTEQKAVKLDK
jgi:16S rRNA G966 N2-methylase RsmD